MNPLTRLRIVTGVFAGVVVYQNLLVRFTLPRDGLVPIDAALWNPLLRPFVAAALAGVVAAFLVRRSFANASRAPRGAVPETAPETRRRLKRKFTGHILTLVLVDGVAVMGMVASLTVRNLDVALPFSAVSLFLFALFWPGESEI